MIEKEEKVQLRTLTSNEPTTSKGRKARAVAASHSAMQKYFIESKVTDRAIIGSVSDLVKIKDPCTGNTMVVIRNPKLKI